MFKLPVRSATLSLSLSAAIAVACGGSGSGDPLPAITIGPEGARTTDALQLQLDGAVATTADIANLDVRWSVDGEPREGLDASVSVPPELTTKGQRWQVEVRRAGDMAQGATADLVVANTPPSLASAALSPAQPRQGEQVTCVTLGWDDPDDDPEEIRVTWTTGATGPTLDTTSLAVGTTIGCRAVPFDGEDEGEPVLSPEVELGVAVPTVVAITLPEVVRTLDDVAASVSVIPDDGSVQLDYAWTVDGSLAGSGEVLAASAHRKGQTIQLEVTPRRGDQVGASVTSEPLIVANTAPTLRDGAILPVAPGTLADLTASFDLFDPDDDDDVALSFAWTVDGAAIGGAPGATLPSANHRRGQAVAVRVTADDGDDETTLDIGPVTIVNTPPTAPGVRISGSSASEPLVCEVATPSTDPDDDMIRYTFSWSVDGREVDVDGDTVDPDRTRDGETWACEVTASDGLADSDPGRASVTLGACFVEVEAVDSIAMDPWSGEIDTDELMFVSSDGGGGVFSVGWLLFRFTDEHFREGDITGVELVVTVRELEADEDDHPFRLARTSSFLEEWDRESASTDTIPYERPYDALEFSLGVGTDQRISIPRDVYEEMELMAGLENGQYTIGIQVAEDRAGTAFIHGVGSAIYEPVLRIAYGDCEL